MLGGLDIPSEGEVWVDGKELSKLNENQLAVFRRRKIGFVFQNYNLIPLLSVYENIILPRQLDELLGKNILYTTTRCVTYSAWDQQKRFKTLKRTGWRIRISCVASGGKYIRTLFR